MKKNIVLITGTSGFVGRYLKNHLKSQGYLILGTVRSKEPLDDEIKVDITKIQDFNKLPQNHFQIIIHTAGIMAHKKVPRKKYFEINAEGTKNLIEWAKQNECNHFIQMSTVAVYGRGALGEDMKEDETKRINGRLSLPYGLSKARAEECLEQSGVGYTILRSPSILGEKDTFIGPSIIPQFQKDGTFYFYGKKDHKFSTLYIKNLGVIIEKLIQKGPLNDVFNCTDYTITWREFIEEFSKYLNIKLHPKKKSFFSFLWHVRNKSIQYLFANSYSGSHFSNEKLKNAINFKPTYPWQDGVKEVIDNFLKNTK